MKGCRVHLKPAILPTSLLRRRGSRRSGRRGGRRSRRSLRSLLASLFRSLLGGVRLRSRLARIAAATQNRNSQERQQRNQCQIPHSQSPFKKTLMPMHTVRAVTLVTATWLIGIVPSRPGYARKTCRPSELGKAASGAPRPYRGACGACDRRGHESKWARSSRTLQSSGFTMKSYRSTSRARCRSSSLFSRRKISFDGWSETFVAQSR